MRGHAVDNYLKSMLCFFFRCSKNCSCCVHWAERGRQKACGAARNDTRKEDKRKGGLVFCNSLTLIRVVEWWRSSLLTHLSAVCSLSQKLFFPICLHISDTQWIQLWNCCCYRGKRFILAAIWFHFHTSNQGFPICLACDTLQNSYVYFGPLVTCFTNPSIVSIYNPLNSSHGLVVFEAQRGQIK